MHKHAEITRQRLENFSAYLKTLLYPEKQPLELLHYAAPGRISYREAIQGEYQPIALGEKLTPFWSTHWFELEFTTPEDWHAVHLRWDSSCEACIWQDGQPVQGLSGSGDYWHAPYHDFFPLESGKTYQLYIETAVNHPFGTGESFKPTQIGLLRMAEIACFRQDIWDLRWDFATIAEMAKFLPADSPRAGQALAVANAMINAFQPENLQPAREIAAQFLSQHNGDSQHQVFAVGHAHIDTAWLWPLAETQRKCIRTFSTALELMERYPEYQFVCSQAQQLDWIKNLQPALYEKIKQRVAEGRFIPVGGAWVEPDCNLPSGESLVRQFLYGQQFYQAEFGLTSREFWLPDTFGYPAALPQIMRGAEIEYFLTQKLSWNQFNKPPMSTFYWEGLDGSRVLTHFPPTDTYNGIATVEELLKGLGNFKDHERSNASLYLFGFGDGGGGPSAEMLERLNRVQDVDGLPRVQIAPPLEFFEQVSHDDLTVWVGELYFELHRGTYTTQAANKKNNRQSELLLRDVEFLAALVPDYPSEQLEKLWKKVLLNQFHDILPGSSIHEVYQDSAHDYAEILQRGQQLRQNALNQLLHGGESRAVVNTLSQARREVVAIDGQLAMVDAPSMGYRVQNPQFETDSPVTLTEQNENFIMENRLLRVEITRTGQMVSLFDKTLQRESIAGNGNQFVLYDDRPNAWEAWDVDVFHLEKRRNLGGATSADIVENGGLRAAIKFTYAISQNSHLIQIIQLDCTAAYVEFITVVEWQEQNQFLKVEFPLQVHTPQATYETQYGLVQRPTHFNTSYDIARFEVCGHRWAALTEYGFGVALLNDAKYGYSAHGNVLSLSLLRSPNWPDPTADRGRHEFRYALYPFDGKFEQAVAAGLRFNVPLLLQQTNLPLGEQSYFAVSPNHVVIDTVKKAEDSDALIVRLYESCGGRGKVKLESAETFQKITRCNLLERQDTEWRDEFEIAPFEVVTLKLWR